MKAALAVSTRRGSQILRCWWCVSEFSRLIERHGDPRSDNSGVLHQDVLPGLSRDATTTELF